MPRRHDLTKSGAFAVGATAQFPMSGAPVGRNGIRRVASLNSFDGFRYCLLISFSCCSKPAPADSDNGDAFAVHDGSIDFRIE